MVRRTGRTSSVTGIRCCKVIGKMITKGSTSQQNAPVLLVCPYRINKRSFVSFSYIAGRFKDRGWTRPVFVHCSHVMCHKVLTFGAGGDWHTLSKASGVRHNDWSQRSEKCISENNSFVFSEQWLRQCPWIPHFNPTLGQPSRA